MSATGPSSEQDSVHKHLYSFSSGQADGNASMKALLGGKGANLAEMARLGLPVPPGFTISTEVCTWYYEHGSTFPESLFMSEIPEALKKVEEECGRRFADPADPLLLSVRSGARASMPGMMDTVLNLGLNDRTVEGLAARSGNERFAWDCYRRFIQMYGDVVLGIKAADSKGADPFGEILEALCARLGAKDDTALGADDFRTLVRSYKERIMELSGKAFPEDPFEQLRAAIGAVFGSWGNERAVVYRRLNHIPGWWGTACNVQAMVFGNIGDDCGTGVAFTRNPATGERHFYGEFLMHAQGEEVVAGLRTPMRIDELAGSNPALYRQLDETCRTLEEHFREMMDIEYTIENGTLYMLQCRSGKRTGLAAIRIAVEMVEEGLIDEKEAIMRIEPEQLEQLLRPVFDPEGKQKALMSGQLLAKGLNAGPGAATGRIRFSAEDAEKAAERGEPVILVRSETSPEDIRGMAIAEGILTQHGGMTSHAALVARQMGRVCVAGCSTLSIDYGKGELRIEGSGTVLHEGDWLSLDGTTGEVLAGELPTRRSEIMERLIEGKDGAGASPAWQWYDKLMTWADRHRRLKVRANADLPEQARQALAFGAEGIGLCRTEHMFFGENRIQAVREMILAEDAEERSIALQKLLPLQREDFCGLFRVMGSRPVTIRLIDPPLHEFLPSGEEEIIRLAIALGRPAAKVRERINALHESNPMLGLRGCRLGILYPDIVTMQAEAIIQAACIVKEEGIAVIPEIMAPLVSTMKELQIISELVHKTARRVIAARWSGISYLVGTMIEVPRAALTSADIAKVADFFSYGTNDLTQMGLGMSRDDSGQFLPVYEKEEIFMRNPFGSIDAEGIGRLVSLSAAEGRSVKAKLKLGVCGEHGGDPASIAFFHKTGLDYISCSPFRLPIARLAAAKAALEE